MALPSSEQAFGKPCTNLRLRSHPASPLLAPPCLLVEHVARISDELACFMAAAVIIAYDY